MKPVKNEAATRKCPSQLVVSSRCQIESVSSLIVNRKSSSRLHFRPSPACNKRDTAATPRRGDFDSAKNMRLSVIGDSLRLFATLVFVYGLILMESVAMVANLHESNANAILGTTLLGPCVKCWVIGIKIHHFTDRPFQGQGALV